MLTTTSVRTSLCVGLALVLAACASAAEIGALSHEFRTLRTQSGHFSGGAWNAQVDAFGGRKQQIMIELAVLLGDGAHTRSEVIEQLGAPDAVLKPGDMMYRASYDGRDPRVRELLVYHWRGAHDFLYFTNDGTQVLGHGWWYAFE